jgi:meso-butanediol dehydrogenase/(S,S)-butanediol dehydrogenase/diacetyl reductase
VLHEGKKVLDTGAGRGVGWGIAHALADEGADVAVADLDADAAARVASELQAKGRTSLAVAADVSSEDDVRAMFDRVGAEFGRLDVLANTVAYIDEPAPVVDQDFAVWSKAIRTNLDSVFLGAKYGIPLLRRSDDALMVNVSSISGTRGFPFRSPYGASKAGLINLSETLAMELLEDGIRVNCLAPGGVAGERIRQLRAWAEEKQLAPREGMGYEDILKHYRPMDPIEIGRYVVWLAGPEAANVNGQALWLGHGPRIGIQAFF